MAAVLRVFGPPTQSIWLSLPLAKFGWNRCSSFDNMLVLIFCALSLKIGLLIYASKMFFFLGGGNLISKIKGSINATPKRHILAWKHVV